MRHLRRRLLSWPAALFALVLLAGGLALAHGTITSSGNIGSIIATDVFRPDNGTDTGALRVASKAKEIVDLDPATGLAIDTGILDVSGYSTVYVAIANGGSVVSGSCAVFVIRDDGSALQQGSSFTVTNGSASSAGSWGQGVTANSSTLPLPRRIKYTCAGLTNADLRITIHAR